MCVGVSESAPGRRVDDVVNTTEVEKRHKYKINLICREQSNRYLIHKNKEQGQ